MHQEGRAAVNQSVEFPTGPEVGELLPDFTLPDQHGRPVTLSQARGGRQALVIFYRSVSW
jgi:peroxiredoxin